EGGQSAKSKTESNRHYPGRGEELGRARSVGFREIHAVGILKAGNLARMVLHFQVSLQNFYIYGLALGGTLTLCSEIFQREIAIMGFDEFANAGVHGSADSVSHPQERESCKHLNQNDNICVGNDYGGPE